jgi:endo-1,4-beta-D-glucanase Y
MSRLRLACAMLAATAAAGCPPPDRTPEASQAWAAYTRAYLHDDGYVLDRTRGQGEVTSEGQSYALLRAVWMRDRATFARVFDWTERTLARADGLYSWRWSPDGGGRVLDANSATDADQDAAFAMILAAEQFGEPRYRARATRLVRAIAMHARVDVPGGWFPSAGNWAVAERIVNLSYFTPYAYPYFERVHPGAGWQEVSAVGYALLDRTTASIATRLPPDFMALDATGAPTSLPDASTLSRRFSFDGIRIPWRVELDCRLHQRERACRESGGLPALGALVTGPDARLVNAYDTSGAPLTEQESPTFYAAVLPLMERTRPDVARRLRDDRLKPDTLIELGRRNDRYYDANWVWFGMALANGWIERNTPAVEMVAP